MTAGSDAHRAEAKRVLERLHAEGFTVAPMTAGSDAQRAAHRAEARRALERLHAEGFTVEDLDTWERLIKKMPADMLVSDLLPLLDAFLQGKRPA